MSNSPDDDFRAAAAREIGDLHVLLQAWFRAEADAELDAILDHFDEGFAMITPAGRVLTYKEFAAGLPGMRGSRPGLVMDIRDVEVGFSDAGSALVTYREIQRQGDTTTERRSTALLLDRADRKVPVWRHLQETWIG